MTKMAAVQMTATANCAQNIEKACHYVDEAAGQGAEFILLPEDFAIIGLKDDAKIQHSEIFGEGPIQESLARAAEKNKIWLNCGAIPIQSPDIDDKVFSVSLLLNPSGQVVAQYCKIHLFDVELGKEMAQCYRESDIVVGGEHAVTFETPFGHLGFSICYDLRFPELYRQLTHQGSNILLVPSAFTYTTGQAHWHSLLRARAIENFSYVIAANQVGTHDNGRSSYGHSMIISPWGEILAELAEKEGIIYADIDTNFVEECRTKIPCLSYLED